MNLSDDHGPTIHEWNNSDELLSDDDEMVVNWNNKNSTNRAESNDIPNNYTIDHTNLAHFDEMSDSDELSSDEEDDDDDVSVTTAGQIMDGIRAIELPERKFWVIAFISILLLYIITSYILYS